MLAPKRTRFRKLQKGRLRGVRPNITQLEFGEYGLKALETGRIPARTIEAVRRVLTRRFKRTGRVWIRVFPDRPVTTKPAESRMGKGKGAPAYWVANVQRGQMLFEMDGITPGLARQAARLAYYKLPLATRFVARDHL